MAAFPKPGDSDEKKKDLSKTGTMLTTRDSENNNNGRAKATWAAGEVCKLPRLQGSALSKAEVKWKPLRTWLAGADDPTLFAITQIIPQFPLTSWIIWTWKMLRGVFGNIFFAFVWKIGRKAGWGWSWHGVVRLIVPEGRLDVNQFVSPFSKLLTSLDIPTFLLLTNDVLIYIFEFGFNDDNWRVAKIPNSGSSGASF